MSLSFAFPCCEQPDHVKDDPLVMREGAPEKICRSSLTFCTATISNIIQGHVHSMPFLFSQPEHNCHKYNEWFLRRSL